MLNVMALRGRRPRIGTDGGDVSRAAPPSPGVALKKQYSIIDCNMFPLKVARSGAGAVSADLMAFQGDWKGSAVKSTDTFEAFLVNY